MSNKGKKIISTIEAWESGELGQDEAFAEVSTHSTEQSVNDALGLQMISIRLQKSLIDDMKQIAELNGLGYQPLIRRVLTRFVEAEKKQLLNQAVCEARKEAEANKQDEETAKCA